MPITLALRVVSVFFGLVIFGAGGASCAAEKLESSAFHKMYRNTKIIEMTADPRSGARLMRTMARPVQTAKGEGVPHGFVPAPLPDDDMSAPTVQKDNTDPYLRPQFYHRRIVNANGMQTNAHDDENRRGHGDLSGGVALTVPLSQ